MTRLEQAAEIGLTRYAEVAAAAGVTYRQADHWARRGLVRTYDEYGLPIPGGANGSGCPRYVTRSEAKHVTRTAALVRAGFTPEVAARVSRESQGRKTVDLGNGVRLRIDWQAVGAA